MADTISESVLSVHFFGSSVYYPLISQIGADSNKPKNWCGEFWLGFLFFDGLLDQKP